ncbi:hypothetical protein [Mesorhizobium sp. 1M-11]|uniref:hypothetical protein n=1 Tax=Mesorhizobium sp. 1M-11 TaxID=1529006 RepID=UPI0006C74723|nr:hypothetical protein [Mesorhizobium sp. 1M-11]
MGQNIAHIARVLDDESRRRLFAPLVEQSAADDLIDALADKKLPEIHGKAQLTDSGTKFMDIMAARAHALGRLPEEFEPEWVSNFRTEAEHLQRLIAECRVDEALAQLHEMVPGPDVLSPAAAKMLAQLHSGQRSLSL